MDFFDLMRSYRSTPAMEADDITAQVNAEAAKSGGISQKKQKKADDEMNNTEDIFGVADTDTNNDIVDQGTAPNRSAENTPDNSANQNNPGADLDTPPGGDKNPTGGLGEPTTDMDDDTQNNPADGTDDGMSGDDLGSDDGSGDDFGGGDDSSGSDMGDDMSSEGEEEDTPEIVKLESLRKNMIEFHSMVSGNLKLLSENTPDILPEQSANLTSVIANLRECKNVLYSLIVEKFNSYTYTKLLSSYVAVQRAYELSAIMLEKYFDQLDIVDEDRAKQKELRDKKAKKSSDSLTKK